MYNDVTKINNNDNYHNPNIWHSILGRNIFFISVISDKILILLFLNKEVKIYSINMILSNNTISNYFIILLWYHN